MVDVVEPETSKRSPRLSVRKFIRDEIKGKSEVSLTKLTNRTVRFVAKDKPLLRAFLLEMLRPMVYEEAQRVIARSRNTTGGLKDEASGRPMNNLVQLGDEIVSRGVIRERSLKMSKNWVKFEEHAGARHILLLDMTSEDLVAAEAERRRRGDTEHEYADLWAKLRARMETGQIVRNVWSPAEIEAAYQAVKRNAA